MPPHGRYGDTSNIRFVPDMGEDGTWMARCPDCVRQDSMCWWPLTLEFWNPKSLQRCRACNLRRKRAAERAARANRSPVRKAYDLQRYQRNGESIRQRARENYYRRQRERRSA